MAGRSTRRAMTEFRRTAATPIENNLIDELTAGELDREEFLRRGAMFGISAAVLGGALALAGDAAAAPASAARATAGTSGGVARVALVKFGGSIEPFRMAEFGALGIVGIPAEYLVFSDENMVANPWLAESWKASANAVTWTFKLRKGVMFHDGTEMTADDVVASFKQYTGNEESAALSVYKGVLSPAGVSKVDKYTVRFKLDIATGGFPYLVSQTTYQAPVQKAATANAPDTWVKGGMIGTGPFKLKPGSYVEKRSAQFVRHDAYWGGPAPLDGVKVTFYEGSAPMALALRAGQVDIVSHLSALEVKPFSNDKKFKVLEIKTSTHRQFCMRVDLDPFKDPRVRRAIALTLGRPGLIDKLLLGRGTIGNDSPFWSGYPSSDPSVKQRAQDVALAKSLLAAAGQPNPKFTITTHKLGEIPDYAAAIQAAGKQAGIDISIELQSDAEYYGGDADDYYGTTPWIVRPATITEWGARAIPNVYLVSAYASDGVWNASHYKNKAFDSAMRSYLAAVDLQTQRKYTKAMATMLLRDTPVVTSYFYNVVTAVSAKVNNFTPEGLGHIRLAKTTIG
ncbi:MAG: peptide ABC transporter substrate-binding protein [Thermoleophilia bacterium]|nr:peptide ABC transporter substrate-binding protein [Thermoleophilia bacterium]